VRDLISGCAAAQPSLFSEDVQALLHQSLSAVEDGADADDGVEPFQRLALFSYDAHAAAPRESLHAALQMMAGVVSQLGGSVDEAAALPSEVLHAMLLARRDECEQRLTECEKRGSDDDGADDGGQLMRGAITTLLAAEAAAIEEALRQRSSADEQEEEPLVV